MSIQLSLSMTAKICPETYYREKLSAFVAKYGFKPQKPDQVSLSERIMRCGVEVWRFDLSRNDDGMTLVAMATMLHDDAQNSWPRNHTVTPQQAKIIANRFGFEFSDNRVYDRETNRLLWFSNEGN